MQKVLLVEDYEGTRKGIERLHRAGNWDFALYTAGTIHEAYALFREHKDASLIVLDGSIESPLDALDLMEVLELGHGYKGPILSIAGTEGDREKMLKHGATEAFDKMDVSGLFEKIAEILSR
ncbi:MAG: response regulator [Patescibacteria group bacterium]